MVLLADQLIILAEQVVICFFLTAQWLSLQSPFFVDLVLFPDLLVLLAVSLVLFPLQLILFAGQPILL